MSTPFAAKDQLLLDRVSELERVLGLREEQIKALESDTKWVCEKCITVLGIYDKGDDLLRIRYKDHVVHVRCGSGGFIRVVCRRCAHINQIEQVVDEEDQQTIVNNTG